LWLIGDGPLRSHLEALVRQHDLTRRVRFLGFRNSHEVPTVMADLDILVLPSRREARGLVAVEAMVSGAATIVSSATGVWGPGDMLQHEETGLVYSVGEIDALTASLLRLMDDPALRARIRWSSPRRSRRRCSPSVAARAPPRTCSPPGPFATRPSRRQPAFQGDRNELSNRRPGTAACGPSAGY
jgi:glycosyltransferase involved in cell wall biosynthesis